MKNFPQIRDVGLFLGGLAGVFHETLLVHGQRPELLVLFGAMMGLPAFLPNAAKAPDNTTTSMPPQNPTPVAPVAPVTPPVTATEPAAKTHE